MQALAERLAFRLFDRPDAKQILFDIQQRFDLPWGYERWNQSLDFQLDRVLRRTKKLLPRTSRHGPSILFSNPRGSRYLLLFTGFLARRLQYEGAKCSFLVFRGCPIKDDEHLFSDCRYRLRTSKTWLGKLELPYVEYGTEDFKYKVPEFLRNLSVSQLDAFEYKGYPLGEWIRVSAKGHLLRTTYEDNEATRQILTRLLLGAIATTTFYRSLLQIEKPDIAIVNNGRLHEYRIAYELLNNAGVDVVSFDDFGSVNGDGLHWMLRRGLPVAHMDISDEWEVVKEIPLSPEHEGRIDEILAKRQLPEHITGDFSHRAWSETAAQIGLNPNESFCVLFPNLTWDSIAVGQDLAFKNMLDWIRHTIKVFSRVGQQLVVRVHPAEHGLDGVITNEKVADFIRQEFSFLPPGIFIIPPENSTNSYQLVEHAEEVIVYVSTIGLEAALRGKTVIVAGRAPYFRKGFTHDAMSIEEYDRLLTRKPTALNESQVTLARRFAWLYFFRSKLPLSFFQTEAAFNVRKILLESLDDLMPGRMPVLDMIVANILSGEKLFLRTEGDLAQDIIT